MGMQNFWDIVEKVVEESDVVLEVLDARVPELTRNKKAENFVELLGKPLILVMNKADMVPDQIVKKERKKLDKIYPCVSVSSLKRQGVTLLKKKIFEIAKKRSRRGEFVKVGVIGYPNTGKSSLINVLAGRKKAPTGPRPGQTRSVQWIKMSSDVGLIDTPGVIPLITYDDEIKHALIGVIDPSKIDDLEGVAREIVALFMRTNKARFEDYYKIKVDAEGDFEQIVNSIGKSRNILKKGGEIDRNRLYISMITDWQRGKLLLRTD